MSILAMQEFFLLFENDHLLAFIGLVYLEDEAVSAVLKPTTNFNLVKLSRIVELRKINVQKVIILLLQLPYFAKQLTNPIKLLTTFAKSLIDFFCTF